MKVTEEFIKHIASLSKIKLTKKEIKDFTEQMQTVLDSANTVSEVSVDGVEKGNKKGMGLVLTFDELREDKVLASQPQEDALKNAPYSEDGYVKVLGTTFGDNEA